MTYIYKITNKLNNKVYIGQTRYFIQHRWEQHVYSSLSNPNNCEYNFLLHKAIRKYGKENFLIEQIECIINEEETNLKERYWIKYYNSCVLNDGYGYNMTYGGEGSPKINSEKVIDLWNKGLGSVAISKELHAHKISIQKILNTYLNYSKQEDFSRNTGVTVYQYDSNGKLLKQYSSIADAARAVKVDSSVISKCCNKQKKSCRGFFWSYYPDEVFSAQNLRTWKKYTVIQKDKQGKTLATYPSLSAAARAMGTTQAKGIKDCCDGKKKEMYGYYWEFKNNENEYVDKLAVAARETMEDEEDNA